jgi:DNA-binding transcriptional regulator LsrR (DeoR family)
VEKAERLRLLVKVAELYYSAGKTQEEIAQQMGLSRTKVSRLLTRAQEEGIVKIEIIKPDLGISDIEEEIEKRFRPKEAIVVPDRFTDSLLLKKSIGATAARYVERVIRMHDVVGVSWGSTIYEVVNAVRRQRGVRNDVVQIIGGLGQVEVNLRADELTRRVAETFGGKCYLLYAPALVESPAIRDAILSDSSVRQVREIAKAADIALVGIGAPSESSILVRAGYLNKHDIEWLRQEGVAGDICCRFFDAWGKECHIELHERVIGISLEDLKNIQRVVGVAGGIEKAKAILGALRGSLIDVIVTDLATAEEVLRLDTADSLPNLGR